MKLANTTRKAVRFLDDIVTANRYVPSVGELKTAAHDGRRIGLGYMGLADLLFATGYRYGSDDGLAMTERVTRWMHFYAMMESIELAKVRGPFRKICGSMYDQADVKWVPPQSKYGEDPAIDWDLVVEGIRKHGIRNAAVTTLAPTGTIGTVAGVEGYGIEPSFALSYTRRVNSVAPGGKPIMLTYASPLFARACAKLGVSSDSQAYKTVLETGSCQGVEGIPDIIQHTFVVASDLSWMEHVESQACAQRFLSNSVSKTINMPRGTPASMVAEAYIAAWEKKCCGLTVFVTGSRDNVPLETLHKS